MILPMTHKEIDEQENLDQVLLDMAPVLAVYFVSFFAITNVWGAHTRLFETVEKTDDVLIILNLGLIMASTFLPYTYTLLGYNWREPVALLLTCLATFLVLVLQAVFIFHAFRTPSILKLEVRTDPELKTRRNLMYISCAVPAVLCVLPLVALSFSTYVADFLLLLMLLSTGIRKLAVMVYKTCWIRRRRSESSPQNSDAGLFARALRPGIQRFYEDSMPKDRVIAFSDGVFSIVATLIILDICEGAVPTSAQLVEYGGLAGALNVYAPLFRAYAATFITVATLWLVHHTLLQYLMEVNKLMVFLNNLCLSCVGLLPFGFKWSSMYAAHKYHHNELVSILLNLCIVFLSSVLQCMIWVAALCRPNTYVHPSASFGGRAHVFVAVRLALYPLVTLILYFLTFASFRLSSEAFQWMEIGMPIIFMIVYFIFKQIRKCFVRRRERSERVLPRNTRDTLPPFDTENEAHYEGD